MRSLAGAALVIASGLVVGGAPLLVGPPGGDDAYYHAMRAQQQARCWLAGVPFPRWYPDLNGGLGGPEPRAYPLVPLSLHAALALAAGDAVTATALASLAIPPLAGLAMLGAARRRNASEGAALAAALAWAAAPYLVAAVHERTALAEGWGLVLLPLVLDRLLPPRPAHGGDLIRAAVVFAALAATQVPMAFMAFLVAATGQLAARTRPGAVRAAAAILLGLALAAASWLPNLDAVSLLAGERLTGGEYGWPRHLFPFTGMSDTVLGGHLLAMWLGSAAAAAVLAVVGGSAARPLAAGALGALALATPVAALAYSALPGLPLLQFPWRWIGVAAGLATLALAAARRRAVMLAAIACLLAPLALPIAWRWRLPGGAPLRPRDPGEVVARAATRYGVPPILPSLPAYLPRGSDLGVPLANAAVRARLGSALEAGPRRWRWRLASVGETVPFPLLAAPGWRVEVDGRGVTWRPRDGLVAVDLPAGTHEVTLVQGLLPADIGGLGASAAGLIVLAAVARARRRRTASPPRGQTAAPARRAARQ